MPSVLKKSPSGVSFSRGTLKCAAARLKISSRVLSVVGIQRSPLKLRIISYKLEILTADTAELPHSPQTFATLLPPPAAQTIRKKFQSHVSTPHTGSASRIPWPQSRSVDRTSPLPKP